jgi:hypothetical protein
MGYYLLGDSVSLSAGLALIDENGRAFNLILSNQLPAPGGCQFAYRQAG